MRNACFILILLLIIYGCSNSHSDKTELIHFIPSNTSLIIKSSNLESLKSGIQNNDLLNELSSTSSYQNLSTNLESLSLLSPKNDILICFSKDDNDSLQHSIITKHHKNLFIKDSLSDYIEEIFAFKKYSITKSTLNNQSIYSTLIDSIFLASSSKTIIENALTEKKERNVALEKLYSTTKNSEATSILIDTEKNDMFNSFSFQDSLALNKFTSYIVADADINQNSIVLNGIAKATDSTLLIEAFRGSIPQENQIAKVTPANSDGFMSFTFDDFDHFNLQLNNIIKSDSLITETPLFDNINEVGVIYEGNNKALILNSIDAITTKDALLNEQNLIETYRQIEIYNYSDEFIFSKVFSPFVTFAKADKYCIIDNFFVFAKNMEMLHNIIANYQNKTTLSERNYYHNIMSNLSDASNLLIVANAYALESILNKNFEEQLKLNLKSYRASAVQFIYDTNFSHINAVIKKHKTKASQNTITEELSVKLDNDLLNAPQLVTNHITKQKEIVVQDINNTLYLISNKGKVLWKKQLNGAVLGNIEQIDMYKNGRLQLAFATPNRVYVLDRNGKSVSPFPLKFNDQITQPLSVFDYDKNKKYRLIVTQGKNVLMYDSKGENVKGFNFKKANQNINHQPQHFRIGSKDYLVFKTQSKIYILDRTGKTRVTPKVSHTFSNESVYLYNNKFTTTSKNGNLISIDTKGNSATQNLNLGEQHHIYTTSRTLVTQVESKLKIKSHTLELEYGNYSKPHIFYINDKIYVSITDLQSQKIYLFDSQGKLLPNFPVYGNSSIKLDNIDKDSALEFVTKGENNAVLLYQMN